MKKSLNLILILTISVMLISCKKTGNKKGAKLEQKEKAPSTLASISEEFDKIFSSIKEIKEIENLSPQEFEILKTKTKDTKDKENKSNEKPKENEKEKTENKIEDKDKELTKKWDDIDKKIEKVHKSWNDYEIEAMKKSANPEKTKEFKNNLNLCTKAVEDRNINDILDTGSKAVLSLSKFFDLYKDEIGGELLKIKYAVYQADLLGKTNIENAKNLLDSTGENITRLRQKLSKDKEKIKRLDKLDLAIGDMKQSLNEDNKKLLELKKDIIINNIKLLEE